jgi:hypothetical protein
MEREDDSGAVGRDWAMALRLSPPLWRWGDFRGRPSASPPRHSVGSGHGVQVVNLRVLRRDLAEVVEALQISQSPALVTKSGHLVGGDLAG